MSEQLSTSIIIPLLSAVSTILIAYLAKRLNVQFQQQNIVHKEHTELIHKKIDQMIVSQQSQGNQSPHGSVDNKV